MAIIAGKDAKINMEMTIPRAPRNAILSVEDTRENYDCDGSYFDTQEVLHKLLFAAEKGEPENV